MAFKTFAPGVLTSSDVNTFLMRQSVITCTAATRPASPNEGMTIYETDTNLHLVYDGSAWQVLASHGAWVSYTPTVNGWTLGNGTIYGAYTRFGRMVTAKIEVQFGSTSAFAGSLSFSLPVNRAAVNITAGGYPCGVAYMRDTTAGDAWPCHVLLNDSVNNIVSLALFEANPGNTYRIEYNVPTSTIPFSWTNGDTIKMHFTYEASTG